MYKSKNRDENYLFKELMPFGGQLDEGNRWLKIKALIPWGELEAEYAKYFSHKGRPGLDGRLVIGLFLLKHMSNDKNSQAIRGQIHEGIRGENVSSITRAEDHKSQGDVS